MTEKTTAELKNRVHQWLDEEQSLRQDAKDAAEAVEQASKVFHQAQRRNMEAQLSVHKERRTHFQRIAEALGSQGIDDPGIDRTTIEQLLALVSSRGALESSSGVALLEAMIAPGSVKTRIHPMTGHPRGAGVEIHVGGPEEHEHARAVIARLSTIAAAVHVELDLHAGEQHRHFEHVGGHEWEIVTSCSTGTRTSDPLGHVLSLSTTAPCPTTPTAEVDAEGWCTAHGWHCADFAAYLSEQRG